MTASRPPRRRITRQALISALGATAVGWLTTASNAAEPAAAKAEEQTVTEELKSETAPTILTRHASIRAIAWPAAPSD